jgi:hypothetical protein
MEPTIRVEDFKDIKLYTTDDEYRSDNPFKEQIQVNTKASKLAILRGRPKNRRIRKKVEKESKKWYKYSHYS